MKLKIFGDIVPVSKQAGLSEATGWMGYYDPAAKEIKIEASLKGDEYKETLIHESLEALWARLSFGQAIDDNFKEVIIDTISKMINENFRVTLKR